MFRNIFFSQPYVILVTLNQQVSSSQNRNLWLKVWRKIILCKFTFLVIIFYFTLYLIIFLCFRSVPKTDKKIAKNYCKSYISRTKGINIWWHCVPINKQVWTVSFQNYFFLLCFFLIFFYFQQWNEFNRIGRQKVSSQLLYHLFFFKLLPNFPI